MSYFKERKIDLAAIEEEPAQPTGRFAKLSRVVVNSVQFAFYGMHLNFEDPSGHTYHVGFDTVSVKSTDKNFQTPDRADDLPNVMKDGEPLYKSIRADGFNIAVVPNGGNREDILAPMLAEFKLMHVLRC